MNLAMTSWGKKGSPLRRSASEFEFEFEFEFADDGIDVDVDVDVDLDLDFDGRAIPFFVFARQRRDNNNCNCNDDGTKALAFPSLLGQMDAAATKATKTLGLLQRTVGRSRVDRLLSISLVGDL
jgi:hypothetical protein